MKTVYIGMCADFLHHGHLRIIYRANDLGRVIVGVLTDRAIEKYKPPPILPYSIRKKIVSEIKEVDMVVPQKTLSYEQNLRKYKPDYVVHGDDWKGGVQRLTRERVLEVLSEWGGQLIEVKYTRGISSTVIKKYIQKRYEED